MQVDLQTDARTITSADLRALLQPTQGPCVSIYVQASPAQGADQGRIRFKDAVKRVERELGEHREPGQADGLLDPLRELATSDDLWLGAGPGLAAFLSPAALHVRRLPAPLPDFAGVADSFHIKPLIRLVQGSERYQILAISTQRVALYEGDRHRLDEVPLHPDVPRNMAEAIGDPDHVTKQKPATWEPDDSDSRDRQLRRYFRRIDDAVWEHHSRASGLPLILAALPEYHTFFHEASHHQNLLRDVAIRRDVFKGITIDEVRELAWEAMRPRWEQQVAELRERYGNANAHEKASDQINDVAAAVCFGKVETLMVEAEKRIGGTVDRGTGELTFKAIADPQVDDVIDDLAEIVLRNDGQVLVLPREMMPSEHGIAAIYRY